MAQLEEAERRRRGRLAYERGRLVSALLAGLPFAVVGGLVGITSSVGAAAWGAFVVFLVAAAALFRGQDVGRAVVPGALAGAVPVALVTMSMRYAHACVGASCTTACLIACVVGGALSAAIVHLHARRATHPRQAWLGGSLVAASMGVVACTCLGLLGVAAVATGLLIGAAPRAVSRAYRSCPL